MTRRRRDIAFYAPWAGPTLAPGQDPSGGAEVQVSYIARGLAQRGLRVAIATYVAPGLPGEIDGVEILRQRRPARLWSPARRVAVLVTSVVTLGRCRARTLVQRSAGGTTGLVAIMARLTRARFVYSSASTADFTDVRLLHSRMTEHLYRLGVRWADEVVVQTEEQIDLCRARFGREPVLIRSVAERAEPRPEGAPPRDFLWIGRMASYKNPLAYVALAEALPRARFTMVCVPGHDPALDEEVRRRGATLPNLELLGPQPRPELLARSALAVAIVSTSDFEGMPNTLLEGWSRGVPALTLAHDPDGLIAGQVLGRTAGGDVATFTDYARELWDSRDAAPFRGRCLDYVRTHHDPERVAEAWAAVLLPGARTEEVTAA